MTTDELKAELEGQGLKVRRIFTPTAQDPDVFGVSMEGNVYTVDQLRAAGYGVVADWWTHEATLVIKIIPKDAYRKQCIEANARRLLESSQALMALGVKPVEVLLSPERYLEG